MLEVSQPQLFLPDAELPDLAPTIHRQRLIVEGLITEVIDERAIARYLTALSTELDMRALMEPATHRSDRFGWAGWIHWETSGAHFYAWEAPEMFFSVDIYTCKPFDAAHALDFTAAFFDSPRCVAKAY